MAAKVGSDFKYVYNMDNQTGSAGASGIGSYDWMNDPTFIANAMQTYGSSGSNSAQSSEDKEIQKFNAFKQGVEWLISLVGKQEGARAEKQVAETTSEANALKQQQENLANTIKSQIDFITSQINTKQEEVKAKMAEAEALGVEINESQASIDEITQKIEDAKKRYEEAQKAEYPDEKERQKALMDILKEMQGYSGELTTLIDGIKTNLNSIDDINSEVESTESTMGDLETQIQDTQAQEQSGVQAVENGMNSVKIKNAANNTEGVVDEGISDAAKTEAAAAQGASWVPVVGTAASTLSQQLMSVGIDYGQGATSFIKGFGVVGSTIGNISSGHSDFTNYFANTMNAIGSNYMPELSNTFGMAYQQISPFLSSIGSYEDADKTTKDFNEAVEEEKKTVEDEKNTNPDGKDDKKLKDIDLDSLNVEV